ncbi:cupin domain-containing protein [Paradesulfitobacterium ferrireducens]|uniref:cupin domain-containing protein n=1 Tax=Paradesulfitobacterium ferrireducens TaxID=2816476 RepID=UPI002E2808D2|nr:cupin domain-containing protein [Paradesulfitobacterium ferrireducens]
MTNAETVFDKPQFNETRVNKVNNFTGQDLTTDTYYFKPGQVLAYHQHPEGDQVFLILKGEGKFYLDNGSEEVIDVKEGSIVYVPKGVWHKLENTGSEMVACQATKSGAGMQSRS